MSKYIRYFEYGKIFLEQGMGTSDFMVLASSDPNRYSSKAFTILNQLFTFNHQVSQQIGEKSIVLARYHNEYVLCHSQFRREDEFAKKLGAEPRFSRPFWQRVCIFLEESEIEEYFRNGVSPYKALIDSTSDSTKSGLEKGALKNYTSWQNTIQIEFPSIELTQRERRENFRRSTIEILNARKFSPMGNYPIEVVGKPNEEMRWQDCLSILEQVQLCSFHQNGILTFTIHEQLYLGRVHVKFSYVPIDNLKQDTSPTKIVEFSTQPSSDKEEEDELKKWLVCLQEIEDKESRAKVLLDIAPRLSNKLKPYPLDVLQGINNESIRAETLLGITPLLTDEIKSQIFDVVRGINNENIRAKFLLGIAPHLKDEFKSQVLDIVGEIRDENIRAKTLVEIVPHLNDKLKSQVLNIVRKIRDEKIRAETLLGIAPHLRDKFKLQVLDIVRKINDEDVRANTLLSVAPHLNDELKGQMLDVVREIKDESFRARTLLGIVPHLNDELKRQALNIVFRINRDGIRAETLLELADYLSDEHKNEVFWTILEAKDRSTIAHILKKYISSLNYRFREDAIETLREVRNENVRAQVLLDLAQDLNQENYRQVVNIAGEIEDEDIRAKTLMGIAPYLNDELKEKAIYIIRQINDDLIRDRALIHLAQYLIKEELIELALVAASKIKNQQSHDDTLSRIVIILQRHNLREKAIGIARAIKDEIIRAEALISLVPQINNKRLASEILNEAENIVRKDQTRSKLGYEQHRRLIERINIEKDRLNPTLEIPTSGSPSESVDTSHKNIPANYPEEEEAEYAKPLEKTQHTQPRKEIKEKTQYTQPPKKHLEEVFFTAYHPKEGKVNTWHTLLVYTHIKSALAEIQEDATRFEDQIVWPKETRVKSSRQIKRGTELTITPVCDGVTFNPSQISINWMEDFQRAEFRFVADKSLLGSAAKGEVTIYAGPLIIGRLKFAMLFNEKATQPIWENEKSVKMYGKNDVFISYSRKDTEVARSFKNVLEASGLDVFLDVDDIRSGQLWEKQLAQRIEQAHIFQLFWSSNYKRSKNCEMEWRHALKQNKEEGYIRPIYWKNPISPKPPKELSKYNFKYIEIQPYDSVFSLIYANLIKLVNSLFSLRWPRLRLNKRVVLLALPTLLMCLLICLVLYLPTIPDLQR